MATYTMNGHRHSSASIQPEILLGIVGNHVAHATRARCRLRACPEKFNCLESPDPQMQIQAALAQIEELLNKNEQLLETVLLLSRALNDAVSFLNANERIERPERKTLKLSHEDQGYVALLCARTARRS